MDYRIRMRNLREDRDLTQKEVGKIIQKSQQGYSHIEEGRAELKIEDFRLHDLRHNAATYYLMNGASETALMELFGWNSREMIKRYAHLTKGHLKDLVEKTSNVFI